MKKLRRILRKIQRIWKSKKVRRIRRKIKRKARLYLRRFVVLGSLLLILFLAGYGIGALGRLIYHKVASPEVPIEQTVQPKETPAVTESSAPMSTAKPQSTDKPEDGVYTFLQGPKSWKRKVAWSGEWGEQFMDGGSFGGFGCGLCCLANIYSTETQYLASPVDMYRYAKRETYYGGGGAIDWGYMRRTLNSLGFSAMVRKKPPTYQQFQKRIAASMCNIVLVSSYDSKCYWRNTPGHYVTIFLYQKKTDKVFLADSGDPNHNRHWVPLRTIYRSLKTNSGWQYLSVTDYDKKLDSWRHKKATGKWVQP